MAEELTRSLATMAERGEPRGAAEVLAAARAEAANHSAPGRPTWRRGAVVAAGAAAVALVLLGIAALLVRPLDEGDTGPAASTTTAPDGTPTAATATADPLNRVDALALDPDGQLWAATAGGVVRWDLAQAVPTVFGDVDGVPATSVMAIDVAPDGTVWAAGDGWIARYDGTWTLFSNANTPLIDSQILAMDVDGNGVVWVDVSTEPPLRYDGTWTQGVRPPPGTWSDRTGGIVAEDGTVWTPAETGIAGQRGDDALTLIATQDIANRSLAPITLTPAPSLDPLRFSAAIGDLEFTTLEIPVGHSLRGGAATPFGPVAADDSALRWSTDGLTWQGQYPTIAPWRITTDGGDVIVQGDGYARYTWDGTDWTETATVGLPGAVRDLAFGPGGAVAIVRHHGEVSAEDVIYHSSDGLTFASADVPPSQARLDPAADLSCVESGPSSSSDPPQDMIGPVLATDAGFVLITPSHPANWSRTPICEPLVWFSADGNSWEMTSTASPFGRRAIVHQIAAHDGRFVAVGAAQAGSNEAESEEGAVWFSTDALSWQRADIEMEAAHGVAGGDLGWVVTGFAGPREFPAVDMWFSADGLTWDGPHEGPEALVTVYSLPELAVGSDAVYGLGATGDTYVIGRLQR